MSRDLWRRRAAPTGRGVGGLKSEAGGSGFGARGHVRAFEAATCRRWPKAASCRRTPYHDCLDSVSCRLLNGNAPGGAGAVIPMAGLAEASYKKSESALKE